MNNNSIILLSSAHHYSAHACTLYSGEELPSFPVDSSYLKAVRRRVSLARQLHSLEHQRNKAVRAEQWISKSAKAMDIEIDEDLYPFSIVIYHSPIPRPSHVSSFNIARGKKSILRMQC